MAGIHHLRYYRVIWVSGTAPVLLAVLLLSSQVAQASQALHLDLLLDPQPQFDLNLVRSRTLPWQQPSMVFEGVDPKDTGSWADEEEHPFLEFTLEESKAAIALFGCDCPAHLNQLRQMRGLPLL